jgi:hypothetical protein
MYTTYITRTPDQNPNMFMSSMTSKPQIPDHHISPYITSKLQTIPEYHHPNIGKKSLVKTRGAAVAQVDSCKVSTKKVTYHLLLLISWLDFDSAKGPILPPTQLASTASVALDSKDHQFLSPTATNLLA